jgi:hypothetical protein
LLFKDAEASNRDVAAAAHRISATASCPNPNVSPEQRCDDHVVARSGACPPCYWWPARRASLTESGCDQLITHAFWSRELLISYQGMILPEECHRSASRLTDVFRPFELSTLQRAVQYLDDGHDVVKVQQVSCATDSRIAYELGFTPFRKTSRHCGCRDTKGLPCSSKPGQPCRACRRRQGRRAAAVRLGGPPSTFRGTVSGYEPSITTVRHCRMTNRSGQRRPC